MKFKNSELLLINDKLSKADSTMLPVRACYAIIKNKRAIATALEPYWETHDAIVAKYANGKTSLSAEEDPVNFQKALNDITELNREEVRVNIRTLSIADMGNENISLELMNVIDFMIKED